VSMSIAFCTSSMLVERFALLSRSSICSRRSSMVEVVPTRRSWPLSRGAVDGLSVCRESNSVYVE